MTEPVTINKALIIPNNGDLSGIWGSAGINPDMTAIDGMLGGAQTIALSVATTFSLSLPTGSLTPGAGPNQSQNALIKFTGTLTGNANITFGMPGFYIVHNACTVGAFYIKLVPSGGGNSIAAPPGQKVHVFYDGTDMDYVDMPAVGSALDLHQSATTLPAWITACTVQPYLIKDGTIYNVSTYPQLGAALGSTFGGNGASTFGVPDELSRARIPVDTSGAAGRITAAGSGVNGTTMGAAGGSQLLQSHAHTASVTDPGHVHVQPLGSRGSGGSVTFSYLTIGGDGGITGTTNVVSATTGISVAANATGGGSSQNVMPVIVSFLPLVKT